MIDRNSPIPLYFQIKKDICHQIDTGELKEGDKLPTEYWYRDHYQVSRVTIRRAIEELVNENVLERERKKGAVVAGKKVNRQLNKMTSSYEDLKKMGVEFETKILSLKPFKARDPFPRIPNGREGTLMGDTQTEE